MNGCRLMLLLPDYEHTFTAVHSAMPVFTHYLTGYHVLLNDSNQSERMACRWDGPLIKALPGEGILLSDGDVWFSRGGLVWRRDRQQTDSQWLISNRFQNRALFVSVFYFYLMNSNKQTTVQQWIKFIILATYQCIITLPLKTYFIRDGYNRLNAMAQFCFPEKYGHLMTGQ